MPAIASDSKLIFYSPRVQVRPPADMNREQLLNGLADAMGGLSEILPIMPRDAWPTSKSKIRPEDRGKVPGLYTKHGRWYGLPGDHQVTREDLLTALSRGG